MPFNRSRVRDALKKFDFESLFIEELGWDRYRPQPVTLSIDGAEFLLEAIAEKRGMVAFLIDPKVNATRAPVHAIRRKIENQVRRIAHEHLIIYVDRERQAQIWQWVRREPGRPSACREHTYQTNQPGDALVQKLEAISFSLDEEEALSIATVAGRARSAFDIERVTKRFYDRFQNEHSAFLTFIEGIQAQGDREWYGSLMLNRLMFVYFIQKKGFLDGDSDYLRNRMLLTQDQQGKDKFHSFYRHFLLRLFHDGLGQAERTSELDALLGKVPYLNGGLFDVHDLERSNTSIEIPDEAFERIFEFFDAYQWHLDTRTLRADNEINPDVLGYIFEKYINQKQMGAYYTKEDITDYIGKSTVVPAILDATRDQCKVAFENAKGFTIWDLLRADPDRYIYPAVRHGVDRPVSEAVTAGVEVSTLHQPVSRRPSQTALSRAIWNESAPDEYALPSETWREVVARRTHYEELVAQIKSGQVHEIDDLVALNLDLSQFAQDAIENFEGPELLRAFWNSIGKVTILDPTCGSGAFLFAALNILEPLYEACLDRMEAFVEDFDRVENKSVADQCSDFREILRLVAMHPNRRYFICKSIILNNLFGVDIMEEAVEICKLRLFLKLAAQVEPDSGHSNFGVEPLPDIDFNIKAGNTLVGFASFDEAKTTIQSSLDFDNSMERIAAKAIELQSAFDMFREHQIGGNGSDTKERKLKLRTNLTVLQDELNGYLARNYGVDPADGGAFVDWLNSFQPFHWFVEFYGIMSAGGFDVVIGNPPYVEKRVIQSQYKLLDYATASTNNLYAYCAERAFALLNPLGKFGFIVPLSSMSTDKFEPLQRLVLRQGRVWLSNFDDRPSRLFDGLEHIQLTIILAAKMPTISGPPFTTGCRKWSAKEREHLFATLRYSQPHRIYMTGSVAKSGTATEVAILDKLWQKTATLVNSVRNADRFKIFYTRKVHGYVNILDFVPRIQNGDGKIREPSEQKTLAFSTEALRDTALCALNSSLFRWYLATFSDCRNLNRRDVLSFPIDLTEVVNSEGEVLSGLARELSRSLQETSEMRRMRFKNDVLNVQCIIPRYSKPIIDKIDHALARHYGFTEEELDFIVNYELKYRGGADEEPVDPTE